MQVVACMANGDKYLYHGEMTFDGIKVLELLLLDFFLRIFN